MNNFNQTVLEVVKNIPAGKTLTYGEVAALSRRPRAARAVGNILNKNYDPAIPCHRVVKANGKIGGYNRGETEKYAKLQKEGVVF